MTDEQAERAGFAIYCHFIRNSVGNLISKNETPEGACVRRWRQLSDRVRNEFIEEARAAIQTLEDYP